MKIRIEKSKLVDCLSIIKDACEGKDALNILRCVKIETNGGGITLTATNLEITVTAKVDCEICDPGAIALVGSALFAFANALPEGQVEIEHKQGASKASVSGGNCRYALAVGDVGQWPRMATIGKDNAKIVNCTIGQQTVRELFRKVKYAASVDSTRRVLCGVNLSTKNGSLTAVATDGARLSCCAVTVDTQDECNCTLTTKTVTQIEKMIGKETENVQIETDGKQVRFAADASGWTLQAKLISDSYPPWQRVILEESRNEAIVDRETFRSELMRVAISAESRDGNRNVKITAENGRMVMESSDRDYSRAKTEMPIKYEGEKVSVSINPHFVTQILGSIDEDEVSVAFDDGYNPISFKSQIPFIGIVMPLHTM